jgi:Flp pilus assembly protein TadG
MAGELTYKRPTSHRGLRGYIAAFRSDDSGVALVEFAILLPMLLLVFAVIVEGGRMMWSYQAAAAGVRDASRYLARRASPSICDSGGSVASFNPALLEIVRNSISGEALFPSSITVNSVTPTLTCVAGTLRVSPTPMVNVSASLTITFPFSGVFELAGGSRPTITTTISDQNKVYGL